MSPDNPIVNPDRPAREPSAREQEVGSSTVSDTDRARLEEVRRRAAGAGPVSDYAPLSEEARQTGLDNIAKAREALKKAQDA
jgi:hypothetical protein